MSPRTGRPTQTPKKHRKSYRLSSEDIEKLSFCMNETGMTETDIVRKGIDLVCREIKKK